MRSLHACIKDVVLQPPVDLWNINMQFGRSGRYINHPANLSTITLPIEDETFPHVHSHL